LRAGTSTSLVGGPELRQRAYDKNVEHRIRKQEAQLKMKYQHVLEGVATTEKKRVKYKFNGRRSKVDWKSDWGESDVVDLRQAKRTVRGHSFKEESSIINDIGDHLPRWQW